ncbi:ankyrin repeat-containing domain protein [Annulohypoxylon bovei var. microspora]|nr:ankyrin repeat-containing domain protein [Annulohypoxylon bovei var. microspora]
MVELRPPLHFAIHEKSPAMVPALLDCGVQASAKDSNGFPALTLGIIKGSLKIIDLLYQRGASLNERGERPYPPIFAAVMTKQEHIIEWLLQKGVDARCIGAGGETPLYMASKLGLSSVVRNLLAYFQLDVSEKCPEVNVACAGKRTPLYVVVENEHLSVINILVEAGADLDVEDSLFRTPLHLAGKHENKNVQEFLLEHGAQQPSPRSQPRDIIVVLENGMNLRATIAVQGQSVLTNQDITKFVQGLELPVKVK